MMVETPPSFIVVGAMKSGTTSLYKWLSGHSGCCFCRLKEPHFFSINWDRGIDWYRGLFSECPNQQISGEASQSYTDPKLVR